MLIENELVRIEFKVVCTSRFFKSSEEFLEFDVEINKNVYTAKQWDETLYNGLENSWILNETTDFFDVEKQEYVAHFFAYSESKAQLFLDSFMKLDYFHLAMHNAATHGLLVEIRTEKLQEGWSRGEKLISGTFNNVHRYINLPFTIDKPEEFNTEFDYCNHFDLGHDKPYSKIMLEWLENFGLTCDKIDCFYTPPGQKIPPHTDANEFNNQIKINISWGPKLSEIIWWTSDKAYKFEYQPSEEEGSTHYMDLYRAEEEDCNIVFSANTHKPSIVNVGFLHSTWNPGTTGRHTLCFSIIHKDGRIVTFSDALHIFKDFIEVTYLQDS